MQQSFTVTPASQTITFGALANTSYPTAPITLTATGSSGLAVSYTVIGPATVSGSTLTVTGAGLITVTASQNGNNNYAAAATAVQQSFMATAAVVAGTVTLSEMATLAALGNGSYQATVKITNSGTGTAQNVMVTTSSLGAANTMTALPSAVGNIAPGGSMMTVLTYPATAGAHGAAAAFKITGTYTGGSFGGSIRATLP